MKKRTTILYCVIVFVVVFFVYVTSPIMTSFDSRWSVHTSLSIINEGNTDLNEYEKEIKKNDFYAIEEIDGKYYSIFPVGTSLISAFFVAISNIIFDALTEFSPDLLIPLKKRIEQDELEFIHLYPGVELVIASFYCALTSVVIFLTAKLRLKTIYAIIIVFIFSFCTSSWSTASRALWQHGPSMLMLSFSALLLSLEKEQHDFSIYPVAIPLSLAFIIRPTNAIPIVFFSVYIFINSRHEFYKYILVSTPFAIAYFAYNLSIYGNVFSNYTQVGRVFHSNSFIEALSGNLISPSRGLFIYSPILIFELTPIFRPRNTNS